MRDYLYIPKAHPAFHSYKVGKYIAIEQQRLLEANLPWTSVPVGN